MCDRKRPRGGRDAKVRIALELCKMAQRCGDIEKQKRALETVCMLYGVDPSQLTSQGLGTNRDRSKKPRIGEDVQAPVTLATTPAKEQHADENNAVIACDFAKSVDIVMADIDNFLHNRLPSAYETKDCADK